MADIKFIPVADATKRQEFLNSNASLGDSDSNFIAGLEITGLRFDIANTQVDGKVADSSRMTLVFYGSAAGQTIEISSKMFTRRRPCINGNGKHDTISSTGTFCAKAAEIFAQRNLTVEQRAQQLVATAPKGIRVNRTSYIGINKNGEPYATSIVGFDIIL